MKQLLCVWDRWTRCYKFSRFWGTIEQWKSCRSSLTDISPLVLWKIYMIIFWEKLIKMFIYFFIKKAKETKKNFGKMKAVKNVLFPLKWHCNSYEVGLAVNMFLTELLKRNCPKFYVKWFWFSCQWFIMSLHFAACALN